MPQEDLPEIMEEGLIAEIFTTEENEIIAEFPEYFMEIFNRSNYANKKQFILCAREYTNITRSKSTHASNTFWIHCICETFGAIILIVLLLCPWIFHKDLEIMLIRRYVSLSWFDQSLTTLVFDSFGASGISYPLIIILWDSRFYKRWYIILFASFIVSVWLKSISCGIMLYYVTLLWALEKIVAVGNYFNLIRQFLSAFGEFCVGMKNCGNKSK